MKLILTLTGAAPLIMHNSRLANPLHPMTRELKTFTGKKKKTDDDIETIARLEWRAGAYETEHDLLGVPTSNVFRCLNEAAKKFNLGRHVKRAVFIPESVKPITVDGEPIAVDKFFSDVANMDYRTVGVQGRRVMRARPIVNGWSTVIDAELDEMELDFKDFVQIVERAGRYVGLCELRPTYGTFTTELEKR